MEAPIVPARNAKLMLERVERYGIDGDRLLDGTGVTRASLEGAGARISYAALVQMHRNAVTLPLPADYGLDAGRDFSIASYGMLGYAMMSSATLRKALDIAVNYYRTAGPLCELTFDFQPTHAAIEAHDLFGLTPPVMRLVVEELFSTFPPLLELLLGEPVTGLEVTLAYPAPANRDHYRRVFPGPVAFDADGCRVHLPVALLDAPLVQADADHAALFERSCQQMLEEIDGRDSFANRIRHLLLSSPGSLGAAEHVASRLNIGARTLRRRLAGEGVSFQALLDEVRCGLAKDYLTTTRLSTQQVAELLGYSEATNFRRAFLRWTASTPACYRRARRFEE